MPDKHCTDKTCGRKICRAMGRMMVKYRLNDDSYIRGFTLPLKSAGGERQKYALPGNLSLGGGDGGAMRFVSAGCPLLPEAKTGDTIEIGAKRYRIMSLLQDSPATFLIGELGDSHAYT